MTPSAAVAHDANGNTLSDAQGRNYTWDFENRLTQAVNPRFGTTAFRYDPCEKTGNVPSVPGFLNFYPYAANNPLRFNDPMGLSAADVQRIFGECQKCTDQLTQSGERRAGSGTLNGYINNFIDFFTFGYHYSGCTRQADLTASCLNFPDSPRDVHWDFTVISTEWGTHHVTMGKSKDPNDPLVICDPWHNTHYSLPTGPGPSGGGGHGGGGGTSF